MDIAPSLSSRGYKHWISDPLETYNKLIVFDEGTLDSWSVSIMTEVCIWSLLCSWAFLRLASMIMSLLDQWFEAWPEKYNLPEPYFVRTLNVRVTAWGLGKITRTDVVAMLSQKIMPSGRNIYRIISNKSASSQFSLAQKQPKGYHLLNSRLLLIWTRHWNGKLYSIPDAQKKSKNKHEGW